MLKIKIWDLLHNIWSEDTMILEWITTELLPELTKKGISWQIHLQSINDTTVLCTLKDISATAKSISDLSLEEFERNIICADYQVRFLLDFDKNSESAYDEEFPIDEKNMNIDIEEILYHCIKLQEPSTFLADWEEIEE